MMLLLLLPACRLITCEDWERSVEGSSRCGSGDLETGALDPLHADQDQSVAAQVVDNQSESHFGVAMAALGDLDGDGDAEFVVGAPLRDSGVDGLAQTGSYATNGGAWLLEGDQTWSSPGTRTLDDAQRVTGDAVAWVGEENHQAGWSLAAGRFVEGDTTSLAMAAPGYLDGEDQSAAWILEDASALTTAREVDDGRDFLISGVGESRIIGVVANLGEHDASGFETLGVATQAPLLDAAAEGAVYLLPAPIQQSVDLDDCVSWAPEVAEEAPGGFGARLLGVDVDMDGDAEIVVGAPTFSDDLLSWGSGAAYVLSGDDIPRSGAVDHDLAVGWESSASDALGAALAAGDLDEDGYPDLAIGAPGADRVYIVSGDDLTDRLQGVSALGVEDFVTITSRSPSQEDLGFALASPGDLDGDGRAELAIGAPRADDDAGEVWLLYGPISANRTLERGDPDTPRLTPGEGTGFLGTGLVAAGDVDGDGGPDLLVSDDPMTGLGATAVTIWRMAGE